MSMRVISAFDASQNLESGGRSLEVACKERIAELGGSQASGIESIALNLGRNLDLGLGWKPGEPLTGTVTLLVREDTELERLRVDVVGEGSVEWREDGASRGRSLHAHEKYVDESVILAEGYGPGHGVLLERGTHRFGFEIQLPRNLPSSFLGRHGSVTYVVRALVHETRRLEPVVVSEPVIVCRPLLVPDEPHYTTAIKSTVRRTVSSSASCFFPARVRLDVHLNRRGQLVNGDLVVSAQVRNSSAKAITCMIASLDMVSTFYAGGREISDTQSVAHKQDVWEVGQGQGRQWTDVRLPLPGHLPGSRLPGCELIDVRYKFRFSVTISGEKRPLETLIPLLVGTGALFGAAQRTSALHRYSETSAAADDSVFDLQSPPATNGSVLHGSDGLTEEQYSKLDAHRKVVQDLSTARDLESVRVEEGATAF